MRVKASKMIEQWGTHLIFIGPNCRTTSVRVWAFHKSPSAVLPWPTPSQKRTDDPLIMAAVQGPFEA